VDYHGYQKHHEGLQRTEGKPEETQKSRRRRLPVPENVQQPVVVEQSKYVQRLNPEAQKANIEEMLGRKDDLIFVSPILRGFSLKTKLWCKSFSQLSPMLLPPP